MQGIGRGRESTMPAWMAAQVPGAQLPPAQPSSAPDWRDVDQVATAAVLQQQDSDLRATLSSQG